MQNKPPPSPRLRHDYLLLHEPPISATTALEAFSTAEGVEAYRGFGNLMSRASGLLPELPELIRALTPDLVAARVCMALDGANIDEAESGVRLDGLLGDDF
jgi:hypothetical protein